MRKLFAASVLSCILFVGCESGPSAPPPFPDGTVVIHKLSKRKGQVTSQGFSDTFYVRFLNKESSITPGGVVLNNERFEDLLVRPFEVEVADPINIQKAK